jgi:hypothetical protein
MQTDDWCSELFLKIAVNLVQRGGSVPNDLKKAPLRE